MHYKYHSYVPVPKYSDDCIYPINFPEVGGKKVLLYCTTCGLGLCYLICWFISQPAADIDQTFYHLQLGDKCYNTGTSGVQSVRVSR